MSKPTNLTRRSQTVRRIVKQNITARRPWQLFPNIQ